MGTKIGQLTCICVGEKVLIHAKLNSCRRSKVCGFRLKKNYELLSTFTLQRERVVNESAHGGTLGGGEWKVSTSTLLQLVNLPLKSNCLVVLTEADAVVLVLHLLLWWRLVVITAVLVDVLQNAPKQSPDGTAEEGALSVVTAAHHQTMEGVLVTGHWLTDDAVPLFGNLRGACGKGVHLVQLLIAL